MSIEVNLSQTISDLLASRYTKDVSDSIQRLTTGLKINDSSDNVGDLIVSNSLHSSSSSLTQGIDNGNTGLALIQVSNKALSSQSDILEEIRNKLELASSDYTSIAGKESIRLDIVNLLNEFDTIASSTNYNNVYTLQNSSSNNDYSLPTTITLNPQTNNSITTQSIKSNSEGFNLDVLKNLTSGELTKYVASSQIDVVDNAILSIDDYINNNTLTTSEIEIAVENLTGIEKTTKNSENSIINADLDAEYAILDKFKLLEQSSEFAFIQANVTQSVVLQLLTTTLDVDNNKFIENEKDEFDPNKEKEIFEPFSKPENTFEANSQTKNEPNFSPSNTNI